MSVILNEPRTVLTCGLDGAFDEQALVDGAADDVVSVPDGQAVRSLLAERANVGCVITAQSLPDTDGVELCRSLRDGGYDVPVMLVFRDDETAAGTAALRAGADDCAFSDESTAQLRDRVDEAVENYAESQLEEEHSDMFTALLEDTPVAIYFKNDEARHLAISEMPGELSRHEVIGKTDLEMYQGKPAFAKEALEDDLTVIEEGEPILEREESYGPDGQKNWALTSKIPWRDDDGSVRGLFGVTRDITAYKHTEQRLEQMEDRVDQFTDYLQHDLKTPLQVAAGNLDLATETGDEAAFEKVRNSLERIEEIIDDLGSITKLEQPEENIEETVHLVELVDGVWDVVESADATIEVELPQSTRIRAAEEALRPVLENLFKNAIDHAGPAVAIRVGQTDQGGFFVADDGPGIPREDRERILQEGFTTSNSGSGTGLSIVQETAADKDWELVVTESADGGARFEINNCLVVGEEPTVSDGAVVELDEQTVVGHLDSGGDGEYHPTADRWLVEGDGNGIASDFFDCYFVYTTVTGPVSIRGHVTDVQRTNHYSKGGLMIRGGLDADDPCAYIGRTPRYGTELLWQARAGEQRQSQQLAEDEPFKWYRIDRVGDQVTSYVSTQGREWVPVDQRRVELGEPVQVGLAVNSVVPGRRCDVTFESIEVVELD